MKLRSVLLAATLLVAFFVAAATYAQPSSTSGIQGPPSDASSRWQAMRFGLFVMRWPADGPLRLKPIGASLRSVRTLTGGEANCIQSDDVLEISLDPANRNDIATIIELTIEGNALDIEPVALGGQKSRP